MTIPIRLTVADQPLFAELDDNPTVQDLAAQLWLALTFGDFNGFTVTIEEA